MTVVPVTLTLTGEIDLPISGGVTELTQAVVDAHAGETLRLGGGAFTSGKLSLPSGITIDGEGAVITLEDGADTHLLEAIDQTGITLRNLTLDGNKANQTVGAVSRCFYALRCSDIRLVDVTVRNAAHHAVHVSTGAATEPPSNSQRIWMTRVRAIDSGGSGLAVSGKYIWLTDCIAEGNGLTGVKVIGAYLSAKGCYAIGNAAGGFTTGFDIVSEEGSVHVYEGCYALDNGNGPLGGDGFRHQGQVDHIVHRDCFAIGNAWSGITLLSSTSVRPTDIDIYGGALLNNGRNFTPSNKVAGAGLSLLSVSTAPNVPTNIRLSGVTITDTQVPKTQRYAIENQKSANVYVGEGCRLNGNMVGAISSMAGVKLSPGFIEM